MGGAPGSLDLEPRETLVADRDLQVGWLGHHCRVRPPLADQSICANAFKLLVHHGGDDQPAARKSLLARDPYGIDHRSDASLHVLRAASVHASVADHRLERSAHPVHADRVDMPTEHQ